MEQEHDQEREADGEGEGGESAVSGYPTTAEAATSFESAEDGGAFQRKKTLMIICVVFAVVIGGGLLWNVNGGKKRKSAAAEQAARAANTPTEFLRNQMDRTPDAAGRDGKTGEGAVPDAPGVYGDRLPDAVPYTGAPYGAYGAAPGNGPVPAGREGVPPPAGGGAPAAAKSNPLESPLVPPFIAGSLFNGQGQTRAGGPGAGYASGPAAYGAPGQDAVADYLRQSLASPEALSRGLPGGSGAASEYNAQNAQDNKQGFYDSGAGGGPLADGQYVGDNALWIGTMVPGILETDVNTDLPGNVLARVTQNIYDSQTGKRLLIPQGTLLVARYNSSVSYAQRRVQIVWDTLIRPDGFYMNLGGMNGVDQKGMSGQEAVYHENWFEYLKAAGLITMFSFANSSMTGEVAKVADTETAAAIAQSNAEFVNQMSGNVVSRAMNIQPTLTVDSGTLINIMLNKTVYLPPVADYPVNKRYIR
jgi:type IV secretory pathway VirB10-like protein